MTTVHLNGRPRDVPEGTTCRDLVAEISGRELGEDGRPVSGTGLGMALALDGEVLPRGAWAGTPLREGAAIELVDAVQGG